MHSFVHGGVFGSVIAMCTSGGCSFHDPPHKYRRFRLGGGSYQIGNLAEAGIAGRNVCILTRVLKYHVFWLEVAVGGTGLMRARKSVEDGPGNIFGAPAMRKG